MKTEEKDILVIYKLMEKRLKESGLYQYDWAAMRNAFQVMRYAFREWSYGKSDSRILKALRYGEQPVELVREHKLIVEDDCVAEEIKLILETEDYGNLKRMIDGEFTQDK